MADHSIKGKTVLIAGGAKNLGGLIARDLAAQGAEAVVIHYNSAGTEAEADSTVAAITGLTDIEDVVPFIRHLVSDGWWITGQTILINGGYATK